MFNYYFDPTMVLVIIGMALAAFASFGVQMTFNKYKDVRNMRGLTAAQAARQILDANGLQNIRIEHVAGNLTDHYSPNEAVIRLSDSTYNSDSVAAIGVAAHECGHAVQHKVGYVPIKIRNSIIPAVNLGNTLSMPLFLIGLILGIGPLAMAGAPGGDSADGDKREPQSVKDARRAADANGRRARGSEKGAHRGGYDVRGGGYFNGASVSQTVTACKQKE